MKVYLESRKLHGKYRVTMIANKEVAEYHLQNYCNLPGFYYRIRDENNMILGRKKNS